MKRVGGLKLQQQSKSQSLSPDGRTPAQQLAEIGAWVRPRQPAAARPVARGDSSGAGPARTSSWCGTATLHATESGLCREVLRQLRLSDPDAARTRHLAPVSVHLQPLALARGRAALAEQRRGPLRAPQGAAEPAALDPASGFAALHPARGGDRRVPRTALPGDGASRVLSLPGHPCRRRRQARGAGGGPARVGAGGSSGASLRSGGAARGRAGDAGVDAPAPRRRAWGGAGGRLRSPAAAGGARPLPTRRAAASRVCRNRSGGRSSSAPGAVGRRRAKSISSASSAAATSWCTTPTTPSRARSSASCGSRRRIRRCWRSSRRSTAPRATRRWCSRSSRPPSAASRWRSWSSSRRASTKPATSNGRKRSKAPERTSPTASSGYKTHAKVSLVVRQEADGLRTYVHLATGNYNTDTAELYTDLGLFSCDPVLGADTAQLFNLLTSGHIGDQRFEKLVVAPTSMRKRVLELIAREAEHQRGGRQRPDHRQDELARGSGDRAGALRRLARRGGDRPDRARRLPAAAGSSRDERDDPGAIDRRSLSRACAHLLLRQRRRPGVLHRLRRLDVAQPRLPGRNDGAGRIARPARRAAVESSTCSSPTTARPGCSSPTAAGERSSRRPGEAGSAAARRSSWRSALRDARGSRLVPAGRARPRCPSAGRRREGLVELRERRGELLAAGRCLAEPVLRRGCRRARCAARRAFSPRR